MKNLFLIFSVLLSTSLSAVEYHKFNLEEPSLIEGASTRNSDNVVWEEGVSQKTINISNGDIFELVYSKDKHSSRALGYELDLDNDGEVDFSAGGNSSLDTLPFGTIIGPATLVIKSSIYSSGLYVGYRYIRASSTIYSSTTATIPAIEGQNWNVELEYSQDLINWSSVAPGTATGSSELQFYRVKVTDTSE